MTGLSDRNTIGAVARLVRSKNAGPFWMTLEVFFDTDDDYLLHHVDITASRIAAIYRVDEATVKVFHVPSLRVTKVSFPRPVTQGGPLDRDVHAGQQHVPLLSLRLLTQENGVPADVAATPVHRDTISP